MYFIPNCYIVVYLTGIISFIIITVLVIIAYYLAPKIQLKEKIMPYECGFQPFHKENLSIEVHFFLIGLTFIIFDMEIMFLYPWFQSAYNMGITGLIGFIFFFFILVSGFIYEYRSGVLRWNY
jgi:NADH-quinone oxidoreductase subunit A